MTRFPRSPGGTALSPVPGALAPPASRVPSGPPGQSHKTAAVRRILIVDEDRALVQALRAALEPRYQDDAAPTGSAAFESITRSSADLVTLDQFLLDLPVDDVLPKMKQTSPSVLVILSTNASHTPGSHVRFSLEVLN